MSKKAEGSMIIAAIDETGNVIFCPWKQEQNTETFKRVITFVPQLNDTKEEANI